ncbi:fructokinase [Marinobacter gudaonensis]|uniref:Fructokinase n=1 Tax=Marinobacter gudaonensis TaxID=375760 RepID=A0A1I6GYR7_9GAMM|nr:carbohydrate kinase [Marinobacter gudaonensis]SFR47269.1 fructokinase [Marinobacter gudaonensis]
MTLDVLCFGEALIDMRAERLHGQDRFVPQPGGAPANVAVGVARLGGRSIFAGQVGADVFGHQIVDALTGYGVDTSWLARAVDANTALAMVALDDRGERSFTFYRTATADLLFKPDQLPAEAFVAKPLFHICSNTLTETAIAETTRGLVARAREQGCLVSFDVNYRAALWDRPEEAPERILELARAADMVKFSREELEALFAGYTEAVISELREVGVPLILVSDGPEELWAWAGDQALSLRPPPVTAVDTTAAGDAFVAGMLYQLAKAGVTTLTLPRWLAAGSNLKRALAFASRCGALTATRFGAFDALPSRADLDAIASGVE